MPGFGRRYVADPRDHNYLMRRMLPDAQTLTLPKRKTWSINKAALNQGQTGTCVGHGWRNFLRCAPIRTGEKKPPSPFDIYRSAVLKDPWPDNDDEAKLPDRDPGMDSGTSVRAGAEALAEMDLLKSYVWSFSLQPAVEFVLTQGPVVLGTNWYSSFNPDAAGVVKISPTASVVGGHCYLWRGVDTSRALALCSNSWGDGWGTSGEFYIPFRDLERLIQEDGEVCSAVQQRLKAKAVMPPARGAFDPKTESRGRKRSAARRRRR
jgi:hypothetical protein